MVTLLVKNNKICELQETIRYYSTSLDRLRVKHNLAEFTLNSSRSGTRELRATASCLRQQIRDMQVRINSLQRIIDFYRNNVWR